MLNQAKKVAKDLLANKKVRNVYNKTNRSVLNVAASHRLLATLYSIPGLITFNREQYAVLRGRRNYYRNLRGDNASHVGLRRNTHRIEKGMVMQPRRPVYGADYIGETIEFYKQAAAQCTRNPDSLDREELQYSHDVLTKYFDLVKPGLNVAVDEARAEFDEYESVYKVNIGEMVPYEHQSIKRSKVTYEDMLALSKQRRSVRWFADKKVPRKLIDDALLVARQAPTACNRLPYEYRVFDDPELVKKVAAIPFGTAGYAHQVPVIMVLVGKLDSYFSPRDRHNIYIDASLSAMSFLFAIESEGLSGSVINWPDFEPLELKMQKALGLDTSERVVMMLAVGYADPKGLVPYSHKKSLDLIRSYNKVAKK